MKNPVFVNSLVCLCLATALLWAGGQFPINFPKGPLNQLTESEKAAGWTLLFNGRDLQGWEPHQGQWEVMDGVIISRNGPSHLFSEGHYKNFELSWDLCAYDVAVPKKRFGNSGVFLRAIRTGQNYPDGYEVQVDHYDPRNPTGGIYGLATGTLLVDERGDWKSDIFFAIHEGKWLHQLTRIVNNRIMVWVNGEKTLDWEDPEDRYPEAGNIALQNHHSTDIVLFTNVKIRQLD